MEHSKLVTSTCEIKMRAAGIFIVCSVVVALSSACCPSYWTQYASSCYRYVTHERKWQDAESACKGLNPSAHLASINSNEENSFLHAMFMEMGGNKHNDYWVGGNDRNSEGNFRWSDGSLVLFQKWRGGEPNGGTGENCIEVKKEDSGWNDKGCDNSRSYICEMPL